MEQSVHGIGNQHRQRRESADSVEKVGAANLNEFFQSTTARRVRYFEIYTAKTDLRRLSAPTFLRFGSIGGKHRLFQQYRPFAVGRVACWTAVALDVEAA